jgi:hypothetical protein
MKRRRLVALGGITVFGGLSGCSSVSGWGLHTPQTPDGMTVETEHWGDGHVDSKGRERPSAIAVTSASEATDAVLTLRTNREDYDPIDFIEETDFASWYLILVEWMGASSGASLELEHIKRRDYGLHVEAKVVEPDGVAPSDVSVHSLFIRVTDEQGDAPERVTVTVRE